MISTKPFYQFVGKVPDVIMRSMEVVALYGVKVSQNIFHPRICGVSDRCRTREFIRKSRLTFSYMFHFRIEYFLVPSNFVSFVLPAEIYTMYGDNHYMNY